jgi:hypothetical protein
MVNYCLGIDMASMTSRIKLRKVSDLIMISVIIPHLNSSMPTAARKAIAVLCALRAHRTITMLSLLTAGKSIVWNRNSGV